MQTWVTKPDTWCNWNSTTFTSCWHCLKVLPNNFWNIYFHIGASQNFFLECIQSKVILFNMCFLVSLSRLMFNFLCIKNWVRCKVLFSANWSYFVNVEFCILPSTLFTLTLLESKLCNAEEFLVLEYYHFRKWRSCLIMTC